MDHLTQQEKDICRMTGVSEKDYLATKKEEIEAALNAEKTMTEADAKERIMRAMGLSPEDIKKMEEEEAKRNSANASLTNEEIKICRLLGITPLDYYEAKGRDLKS